MKSKAFNSLVKSWVSQGDKETLNTIKYSSFNEGSSFLKKVPSLGDNSPDWSNIIGDPPSNAGSTTLQELKTVQNYSNKSTDKKSKEKILRADRDMDSLFLDVIGSDSFSKYEEQIIKTFYGYLEPVIINLKWKFDRPRPYQLGELLGIPIQHITTKTHHTPAYPSGHAAYGAMMARILSYTRPEKTQEFHSVQNQIGIARVMQGVHYPSDNFASIFLVETLWKFFNNNVLND
jgi:hypothetical protein